MWNERFAADGYAYGEEPNEFLAESMHVIPRGRVLCLAEGQGRNAVYLARQGYEVTAVDWSEAGLAKANQLAIKHGVNLTTELADLNAYKITPASWSGIIAIFAHLEPSLRQRIHGACVNGLVPGGVMILEAYSPEQLSYGTGGPKDPEMLMTRAGLIQEFAGLNILHAAELVRHVSEGRHHTGDAAVVQFIGQKSKPDLQI